LFPNPLTGSEYSVKRWIKTWNLAKKALGIKGVTAYQMTRHSYASQLGAAGVPIHTIKNLLGHTEITTTQKYTHPDLESMRTAIEKLTFKNKVVEMKQKKEHRSDQKS
jgi:site-specific recombinase XerD